MPGPFKALGWIFIEWIALCVNKRNCLKGKEKVIIRGELRVCDKRAFVKFEV